MAIQYLSGNRLQGTSTERTALNLSTPPQTGWKEVGRETLSSAATSITCSFTPKDNMTFLFFRPSQSSITGNGTMRLGYNSVDSGSNYSDRSSSYGNSDGTNTGQSGFNEWDTGSLERFDVLNMPNIASKEKLVIGHGNILSANGAGTAPYRREYVAKWANTSNQANRFYVAPSTSGTGYAAGTEIVALGCDDDEADSGSNFWQELADVSVSSGSTIDTGTITAKKYLYFQVYTVPSGTSYSWLQFNSDTGSNYASRYSTNNGGESTSTSSNDGILYYAPFNSSVRYMDGYIVNKSGNEKLVIGEGNAQNTAGAGNGTERRELYGKWANTSDSITSIQVKSKNGSFATGTRLRVWGAN